MLVFGLVLFALAGWGMAIRNSYISWKWQKRAQEGTVLLQVAQVLIRTLFKSKYGHEPEEGQIPAGLNPFGAARKTGSA